MNNIGLEILLLASGFYTVMALGLLALSVHTKNMVKENDKVYREQLKTMRSEIGEIKSVVKRELGDFLKQVKN